eukprot:Clim_evm29s134 gene=Clim_evmTU29s134
MSSKPNEKTQPPPYSSQSYGTNGVSAYPPPNNTQGAYPPSGYQYPTNQQYYGGQYGYNQNGQAKPPAGYPGANGAPPQGYYAQPQPQVYYVQQPQQRPPRSTADDGAAICLGSALAVLCCCCLFS